MIREREGQPFRWSPLETTHLHSFMEKTALSGASYIPRFLTPEATANLKSRLSTLDFTLYEKEHRYVSERYWTPSDIPRTIQAGLHRLGRHIEQVIRNCSDEYPILESWTFREVSIQKYDKDSYLTSHRDKPEPDEGVIVVVTTQGESPFETRKKRHGPSIDKYVTREGSGILLRSSGLDPNLKGHPGVFHEVSGAQTEVPRISLIFRNRKKPYNL